MIIDDFVKCAVEMARATIGVSGLYICPELPLSSVDLGVEGLNDVSGKVNYVTALLNSQIDVGNALRSSTADLVLGLALRTNIITEYPDPAALCSLFEAKQPATVGGSASKAEAIGGLLVLRKHA